MSDRTFEPANGSRRSQRLGPRRVFVANRGEIAARIERTCRRLGIGTILPERDLSGTLDLLDAAAVVAAAVAVDADAIHPGYGFLAESAAFARAVVEAGLGWIGPPADAIAAMGDKAAARRLARSLAVPVLPGYDGAEQSDARLEAEAAEIGMPLLVKPAAGGGGKGMRAVREPTALPEALAAARREALAAFADDRLVLERLLEGPRHVEIQVLFDKAGAGVHLGERDCSYQRRHQKVIEEAPSPAVSARLRSALGEAALTLSRAVGYVSTGTVEFLVSGEAFYFLEMNTRLQVEHPVTELVTGRDLVADQLRIAAGEPVGFGQADVRIEGHAIEARLYAEDAEAGFLPATGRILDLVWPSGPGIRVDAGVELGTEVSPRFDPLLAKIVAFGPTRGVALDRLAGALRETVLLGVTTNLRFLRWLVERDETRRGDARVDTLERIWRPGVAALPEPAWRFAAGGLLDGTAGGDVWAGGWRMNAGRSARLAAGGEERLVRLDPAGAPALRSGPEGQARAVRVDDNLHLDVDGRDVVFRLAPPPEVLAAARAAARHAGGAAAQVEASMPGSVLAVHVRTGDVVEQGEPLVTLGAMKMEHAVSAPVGGCVAELNVTVGEQVARGQILAVLEPEAAPAAGQAT